MGEKEICRCRCDLVPLISIIIPAYNTEKYLSECIDSLCSQITDDVEIIIVNDGSTDSTRSICDKYYRSCDHISVIHNQSNMGTGVGRNSGIDLARGKYLWFVDSDDYAADDAITTIKNNLSDELDMLLFAATSFSDGAELLSSYERTKNLNTVMTGFEFMSACFKDDEYYSPVWLCIYNRSFLNQHNMRFGEERTYEDEQFTFISYLYARNVKAINQHLILRRYRQGSIMVKSKSNNEENFRNAYDGYGNAIKKILKIFDDLSDADPKRKIIIDEICQWFMLFYTRYSWLSNDDKKRCWPMLKELCKEIGRYKSYLPRYMKKRIIAPRIYNCYWMSKAKLISIVNDMLKNG